MSFCPRCRATLLGQAARHKLGSRIARAWAELMERLGYQRYVSQGELFYLTRSTRAVTSQRGNGRNSSAASSAQRSDRCTHRFETNLAPARFARLP
jgi:hypothetical protein